MNAECGVAYTEFSNKTNGSEHFFVVTAAESDDLLAQIRQIEDCYAGAIRALGLAEDTAIFRRLFVSDVINQGSWIRKSALARESPDNPVAVSLVQQPPANGSKLVLLAYHAAGGAPTVKRRLSPHHLIVETGNRRHVFSTGLCAAEKHANDAYGQARHTFDELTGALAKEGGSLRDNCVRTWLYLKDIDVFYKGMVEARSDVFAREGLSRDTHFIASTGIEGACGHQHDLVAMDAYSILDLAPGQIEYLNDFDRLCPTADYNVHFERGTSVAYRDRAHHFISGTASIDRMGQVVHECDVRRQLERALSNVEALLRSGEADLADLTHLIVYLRDPADATSITQQLAGLLPGLPIVIVQAAVCRPQWLVEVEGIAITPRDDPSLLPF